MRMIAQRAAAAAVIARLEGDRLAVADVRVALPREGPNRGERDVGRVEGDDVADRALSGKLQSSGAGGVIVHLQLDLAENARVLDHLYHPVVFLKIEGGYLHGEHVLMVFAAKLHIAVVAEVLAGDDDAVDLRVLDEHLLGAAVDGDVIAVVAEVLLDLVGRAGDGDPVYFVVVMQSLIIFTDMGMSKRCYRKIDLSHFLNPPLLCCSALRWPSPRLPRPSQDGHSRPEAAGYGCCR